MLLFNVLRMIPVAMPGVILNACEGSLGVNDENFRYAQNDE